MANSRLPVPAPAKSLLGYGLFSVSENRSDPAELRGHWKSGIEWQNVCPDGNTTYDECIAANSLGSSAPAEPSAKSATASRSRWAASPFTVFVEIDCSAPGFWENADEIVAKTFGEAETFEVESVFLTGTVGAVTGIAYPHLAAGVALIEGDATLQLVAANVGPTGGSLDVVEAFGKLDQALSACVKGEGVIHLPTELLAHAMSNHLVTERAGVLYSPAGHKIAVSQAYTGIASDGTDPAAGTLWVYATGPTFMYRSKGKLVGSLADSLDLSVNTVKRIFERTYVVGYDCCLFSVLVSTGGVATGTSGSSL